MPANLKRVISFAISDFGRNKGISVAAVFVLIVMISLVTILLFTHGVADFLTEQIQNKIDITAYFKDGAAEKDILSVKDQLIKNSPSIKKITYISQDQAKVIFSEKHSANPIFSKALQQVGDNPFLSSLNISTDGDPSQYAEVSKFLQTSDFSKLIDSVDYSEKKDTIEKIYSISSNINKIGIVLGIILIIVSVLVVFNTIKLAVENSRDEISTMRIVGATNWFIRGPFVIQGMIYGIISFIICFTVSGIVAFFTAPEVSNILPGFNIFDYFLTNSLYFVLIQLGFGVGVGVISSFIVVKRYLVD